jgi:hypothetical protein
MVADGPCRSLFLAKVFASTLRDDAADRPEPRERLFACFRSHPLTFLAADHDLDGRFDRVGNRWFARRQLILRDLIEKLLPTDRYGSRCADAEAHLLAGLHAEHRDCRFITDAQCFPDPSS